MTKNNRDLLIELTVEMRNVQETINNLEKKLFGNGQEGLGTKVIRHDAYFAILSVSTPAIAIIISFIVHYFF